jgi:hypothetical protein
MKKSLIVIFLLGFIWAGYPDNVQGQGPSLTTTQLKNATYLVQGQRIKLGNGSYQGGTLKEANFLAVDFDKAALGDLNNDGIKDAAVIYSYNGGGSGSFVVMAAMMNQNGNPVQVAAVELGDRVEVRSISIKAGKIILKMLVHGPHDGLAQPTVKQTRKYVLAGSKLVPSR